MEFLVDVTKFYIGLFSHDTNVMHSYSGVAFVCVSVCVRVLAKSRVAFTHARWCVSSLWCSLVYRLAGSGRPRLGARYHAHKCAISELPKRMGNVHQSAAICVHSRRKKRHLQTRKNGHALGCVKRGSTWHIVLFHLVDRCLVNTYTRCWYSPFDCQHIRFYSWTIDIGFCG